MNILRNTFFIKNIIELKKKVSFSRPCLYAKVGFLMVLEGAGGAERLLTDITGERLLPGVHAHVSDLVVAVGEGFATNLQYRYMYTYLYCICLNEHVT